MLSSERASPSSPALLGSGDHEVAQLPWISDHGGLHAGQVSSQNASSPWLRNYNHVLRSCCLICSIATSPNPSVFAFRRSQWGSVGHERAIERIALSC